MQPGLIYGIGDTSAARRAFVQFLTRKLPMVPLHTAYSWGHIEDIVRGHIAAMERGRAGQNYHECGPSHTLQEAFKISSAITGVPMPRFTASPGVLKAMSLVMGVVEKVVTVPEDYSSDYLGVSAGVTYIGKHDLATCDLSFHPRSLESGLRETLDNEMRTLGLK